MFLPHYRLYSYRKDFPMQVEALRALGRLRNLELTQYIGKGQVLVLASCSMRPELIAMEFKPEYNRQISYCKLSRIQEGALMEEHTGLFLAARCGERGR